MKSHHAEAYAERILVDARRAGGRIRRDAELEARRIRSDAALDTGEAVERLEREVARVAGELAEAIARFRGELEESAASERAAPTALPLPPIPSPLASSRRASMRDSPLAHLFRATNGVGGRRLTDDGRATGAQRTDSAEEALRIAPLRATPCASTL